jgi:hypothetical protein
MMKKRYNVLKNTKIGKFIFSLENHCVPYRITFFIMGIVSTLWFLIRVIPKPSRASYPCMRAAAPIMSSFIIYLLTISGTFLAFRKSKVLFKKAKYIYAFIFLVLAIVAGAVSLTLNNKEASARSFKAAVLPEGPNNPMGTPMGLMPGRVAWAWDVDATVKECTNEYVNPDTPDDNDGYFMDKNNDQDVINRMTRDVILRITGKSNLPEAWDAMFKYFNNKKGLGEVSYSSDQTIFIKINQGTASWASGTGYSRIEQSWAWGKAESTGHLPLAILTQLIEDAGVPQDKIYIGDPIAHIWQDVYEKLLDVYPNINYVDKSGTSYGRTAINPEGSPSMEFSDKGHIVTMTTNYLYDAMSNADYLINLACLKAHERAGITMCTKNHFGSHTEIAATHMHPGLVWIEESPWDGAMRDDYGMYRVLVDWMGHEKAGGNTMLFMVDGLWGGPEATMKPVRWQMYPFNDDWPNSIFASLDPVALESVGYDFLRTEFTIENHPDPGEYDKMLTFPQYNAIDDYLHQAADVSSWPTTIYDEGGNPAAFAGYDPEGDGSFLTSLGVHEHWNDEINMQYSRNLGTGEGIELVKIRDKEEIPVEVYIPDLTAPVIDGIDDDAVWDSIDWVYIDQVWIPYAADISSSDFSGAFKVIWSAEDNLLYVLAETIDNSFVDTTMGTSGAYYEYDVLEIFIDEDNSGGDHIYDVIATGENAENAFSYHINAVIPADGGTTTEKAVYDLDGTGPGDATNPDYEDHFPEFAVKRTGNKLTWEFSMKVYDDTYEQLDPNREDARVFLEPDKEIGFAVAYCDADDAIGRDNFFGSDWGPDNGGQYNDHWMNADGYGTLILYSGTYTPNNAPYVAGSIADVDLESLNTEVVVVEDINAVFDDVDGDPLIYNCSSDDEDVTVWLEGDTLKVSADSDFDGTSTATVEADDSRGGKVSTDFNVTYEPSSIITNKLGQVEVYPNPMVDGLLHVSLECERNENIEITFYNSNGKLLKTFRFRSSGVTFKETLDISDIPEGIYFVKIKVKGTTITRTIII